MKAPPKRRPAADGPSEAPGTRFLDGLSHLADETRGTYRRALRDFLRWAGGKSLESVNAADVVRYRTHLLRDRRFKPASVGTYLTAVRRFYAFLAHEGTIGTNPARSVGGSSRPRTHVRRPLTGPELAALLAAVEGAGTAAVRDRAMVLLMLRAAVSETELVRLRLGHVRRSGGVFHLSLPAGRRSASPLSVPVGGDAAPALERYLRVRGEGRPDEPLFTSAGNRSSPSGITTRTVRTRLGGAFDRAGIAAKGLSAASLRMTAAANLIDAGGGRDEVRRVLRLGTATAAGLYRGARDARDTN